MNPALLKLELMAHGIKRGKGLPEILTNPFGLVHLVLPEKIPVSIHLNQPGTNKTPYTLSCEGGLFLIESVESHGGEKIPVRWTPPLKCYSQKTSSGVLVGDMLTVHGGFIAIHPKGPCRFGLSGLSCRYCGSSKELSKHPPFSKKDLIEAIRIVLQEKRCHFVHLSSGHVETEDGGVEWLSSWVAEIRKHINILISLDLVPPKTNEWIDKAYAIGTDSLYYDTDFTTAPACPVQDLQNSFHRQLEALAYAAKIFPRGAVLSHIVIGLEPMESTRQKIDLMIQRNVVPILVFFPPYAGTELANRWTITPSQITELYAHQYEGMMRARLAPHWVQQFDVVVTPLEGRFFSSESPRHHLALKRLLETDFGRTARLGLAGLRRHLRVREVPAP